MLPKDPVDQQTAHLGTHYKERNILNELNFLESLMAAIYMLAGSLPFTRLSAFFQKYTRKLF